MRIAQASPCRSRPGPAAFLARVCARSRARGTDLPDLRPISDKVGPSAPPVLIMDFLPASSRHARQAMQSEKSLMKKTFLLGLAALMLPVAALAQVLPSPPVAAKKPHQVKGPGGLVREDPYYWLRDDTRKNPEMLAYLNAENAYADAALAALKPLQEKLYSEFVGRIKQDDSTVPYRKRGYHYYSRFEAGQDYPIIARRRGSMTAPEEVLLDQPAMGKDKAYFQVSGSQVSPDNRLLAYAEDVVGRRQYVLRVKEIASGRLLPDEIPNVEANYVWADDNRTIYYLEKDPVTLLSRRVKAHVLGTPVASDRIVHEEKDDS